jgi:hypothetical protein
LELCGVQVFGFAEDYPRLRLGREFKQRIAFAFE